MRDVTRRNLMKTSVAAALGASVVGAASGEDSETTAPTVKGDLKRFSSMAFGAEATGPYVFEDGSFLYSLQHPSRDNPEPFDRAGIGYVSGFQFEMDGSNDDFSELPAPETDEQQRQVLAGEGEYELLAREEDPINYEDGEPTELLGVAQTPDGTNIVLRDGSDEGDFNSNGNFAGTQYGNAASNPDCNQFVATNGSKTEGYLFTNWENSPGNVTRVPLSQTDEGEWEADLENAINLANTEPMRELGGTRINCYGDMTPWGTMVSSEENYAHTRVSLTATVGDIVEKGTGKGIRGGHDFWNRPNPTEIQAAVGEYYGDEAWYVQGYWALDGVELLAYHLGADPRDQSPGTGTNMVTPIGEGYPNPYRHGYHVDIREPAADPPQPVKYWVMGRAAWEAPDFQQDRETVYGCSDGDSKGIYKFVAERPMQSYRDPMDTEGTLYAPKVTNSEAATKNPPSEVDLELEWLELGHASNREVESWIADYDDITQVDYLETHTDWTEGDAVTAEVLEAADREVVENGNQDFITDDEIVQWAEQYENRGPRGVDEELRRVPFLETRAAAKEIGATIEFNKAEGVDSGENATPGDYVYFGISEFNDDLSNDIGDIQTERVDGGVVYRGELTSQYNITTLEPVIVGPKFSQPADVANDALRNVDNVYVMDDGRVLCLEDGFAESNRSYPNDCVYVFEPEDL
jgi:secreted PhoX family phosphatase